MPPPQPTRDAHTRQRTQKTPEPLLSAYVFPIFGNRRSGTEANKKYVLYKACYRCVAVLTRVRTPGHFGQTRRLHNEHVDIFQSYILYAVLDVCAHAWALWPVRIS